MQATVLQSNYTIKQLKALYDNNEITPLQVVNQILERVELDQDNPIWITAPTLERITPYIEALQHKDKALPLWGIPFAVKDNIDVAGFPTTAGCAEYAYTPAKSAFVVQQLVDAGAIPVGKTNLDQFATGLVGTRSPYGVCQNAYDATLISGGSSSGSAVAVARGHAVFSLGTDTAGSGRVPAALNKLVGFKSSRGAWSTGGVVPACESLDCVTVFANTAQDALLVDQQARAFDKENGWSQNRALQPLALPTKILLVKQQYEFFGPFAKDYEAAWHHAVDRLMSLGLPVDYIEADYLHDAAQLLYEGPLVAERWASLNEFIEQHPNVANPVVENILRRAQQPEFDATSLFKAQHLIQRYRQQVQQQLQGAVLIMPTVGGTWTIDEVLANPVETNSKLGLYTNHCNILDLGAINVPANTEIPFGITAFANGGEDHLLHGFAELFGKEQPMTVIAACGLHLKGYPLEKQMLELGCEFLQTTTTSADYRLVKIEDGLTRPGLVFSEGKGQPIEVDLWAMPTVNVARFMTFVKAPLALGKITLQDGREVIGFVCAANLDNYSDITESGGWRYIE
ncbi:MAG: allophanate hydrolase [Solibacillus sp.]